MEQHYQILKRIDELAAVRKAYEYFFNRNIELVNTTNDGKTLILAFYDNKNRLLKHVSFNYS